LNQSIADFSSLISGAWLITMLVWIASSFSNTQAVRRQATGSRAAQICFGVFAGLLIWGPAHFRLLSGPAVIPDSEAAHLAAFLLTLGGLAFALWSRFIVGRNWSAVITIKQDHELIRSGPYAIVRHPIYCGFLTAVIGAAIERGTIEAFAGAAILAIIFRFKSELEEKFMIEHFGDAYRKYRMEVGAIIPFPRIHWGDRNPG
jgi:protein-S-isoprenylcysteine O-methyltransferase Ste14